MNELLKRLGFDPCSVTSVPFISEEDHSAYQVWKVTDHRRVYVLKKAKKREKEIYEVFLKNLHEGVPQLYKTITHNNQDYLLMEYIEGQTLQRCTEDALKKALDALIFIQNQTWNQQISQEEKGLCFSESLIHRQNRGKWLNDSELEEIYAQFLNLYKSLPRALCHDDLLPFNVIINAEKAVLIDWETAGILPYPVSLARLIAHGEEDEQAFFYLSEKDRTFALEYYYHHLVKDKGISFEDYQAALNYFIFYELCEWIMLGNKYDDADQMRCKKYTQLAKELGQKIRKTA